MQHQWTIINHGTEEPNGRAVIHGHAVVHCRHVHEIGDDHHGAIDVEGIAVGVATDIDALDLVTAIVVVIGAEAGIEMDARGHPRVRKIPTRRQCTVQIFVVTS